MPTQLVVKMLFQSYSDLSIAATRASVKKGSVFQSYYRNHPSSILLSRNARYPSCFNPAAIERSLRCVTSTDNGKTVWLFQSLSQSCSDLSIAAMQHFPDFNPAAIFQSLRYKIPNLNPTLSSFQSVSILQRSDTA